MGMFTSGIALFGSNIKSDKFHSITEYYWDQRTNRRTHSTPLRGANVYAVEISDLSVFMGNDARNTSFVRAGPTNATLV